MKKFYCKNCNKLHPIKENFGGAGPPSISASVWGGAPMCDPNDPASMGVC